MSERREIAVNEMMLIGKFFKENNDYINMMKVNKKYRQLTSYYHYNPISDCSLFGNMERMGEEHV